MKETLKLILILTGICLIAGFLLAKVNDMTREPIRLAKQAELVAGLKKVLPDFDNVPAEDLYLASLGGGQTQTFYIARQQSVVVGTAFEIVSKNGYGGDVKILIGADVQGTIKAMEILEAKAETPGLGAKIVEPEFRDQFSGKSASDASWSAVTKDGGQIEAITGATISSRAVAGGVKEGLALYVKNIEAIKVAPEPKPVEQE